MKLEVEDMTLAQALDKRTRIRELLRLNQQHIEDMRGIQARQPDQDVPVRQLEIKRTLLEETLGRLKKRIRELSEMAKRPEQPRVFIIHEPLRRDPESGNMIPTHDLTPAAHFGELTFVVPSGDRPSYDPEGSLRYIRPAMADYMPEDFIVAVGDMALVSWAVALAARATDGYVRILRWDGRPSGQKYYATSVELWKEKQENVA